MKDEEVTEGDSASSGAASRPVGGGGDGARLRRLRRCKSFSRAEEIVTEEEKQRRSQPDKPIHKPRDSIFSLTSGFTNYEGMVNWAFLLLSIGGARLLLENLNKYGIRVNPFAWSNAVYGYHQDGEFPVMSMLAYTNVPIFMALGLEKVILKNFIRARVCMILHIVNIVHVLILPIVVIYVKYEQIGPVESTTNLILLTSGRFVTTFVYALLALKLVSYVHVNFLWRSNLVNSRRRKSNDETSIKYEKVEEDTPPPTPPKTTQRKKSITFDPVSCPLLPENKESHQVKNKETLPATPMKSIIQATLDLILLRIIKWASNYIAKFKARHQTKIEKVEPVLRCSKRFGCLLEALGLLDGSEGDEKDLLVPPVEEDASSDDDTLDGSFGHIEEEEEEEDVPSDEKLKVVEEIKSNFRTTAKQQQRENAVGTTVLVQYPDNLTVSDIYYFWFAPTLCYELNFPKSLRIRKTFLLRRFLEVIFGFNLLLALIQQWIIPSVVNSLIPFSNMNLGPATERLLKLSIPNHLCWLIWFYLVFHSFTNTMAEVMRFADRNFYNDWWNADNIVVFWKTWNLPVHRWCVRHLYKPVLSYSNGNKMLASAIVFFVSAFFHEYMVSVPLRIFKAYAFFGMMFQVPLMVISTQAEKHLGHPAGNIIVWLSLIIGQPMAVLMYYHDFVVEHYGRNVLESFGTL